MQHTFLSVGYSGQPTGLQHISALPLIIFVPILNSLVGAFQEFLVGINLILVALCILMTFLPVCENSRLVLPFNCQPLEDNDFFFLPDAL